ncbi:MAG: hypothetical protein ABIT01_08710, partial [Thermoanaerobaculia bacterium]
MPSGADWRARLLRWVRPRPSEILILLNALLVAAVLRVQGHLELQYLRSIETMFPALKVIAIFILLGFVLRVFFAAARRGRRHAVRYVKLWF